MPTWTDGTHSLAGVAHSGPHAFGARYYQSELGRFLSPDWSPTPEAVPYANLSNPQSLNLYSYVLNKPTTATDPDGHFFDGGNCGNPCNVYGTWIPPSTFVKITLRFADFLRDLGRGVAAAHTTANAFVERHPYLVTAAVLAGAVLGEGGEEGEAPDEGLGAEGLGIPAEAQVSSAVDSATAATGNESISVGSRAIAERAADEFLGAGSHEIISNRPGEGGPVAGRISADGQRVVVGPHGDHFNFVNKRTGGNLHVRFGGGS